MAGERSIELADPVPPLRARRERSARVYRIALEMANGTWTPERSEALAIEWCLAPASVRHYSAEASRMLEWTANDKERIREAVVARLWQIIESEGEDKDVISACKLVLEVMGERRLGPAVQVNVGTMSDAEYSKHLRAELRDPDDALLAALAEPGVIEGLNALVHQRRKMLVETTGEEQP